MKLWLTEPWKARVRYLRPYYANWKPQQRDHPVNSPDVWYLPLVWTSWCTVMAAIILLALCLGDMMDSFLTVQHLNFALYLNSPLIVIWWRFAVLMSESESNSRYYKSKQRHCNCSMCSHHLMRNGCVVTRLYNGKVPVTMVIPPLKHKCCLRRRVKFIVCKPESTRVISLLLMLAGDVESNPGPAHLDLRTICEELATVKVKWSDIGLQLNIPLYKLKEFEGEKNPFASVIDYWLNGNVTDVPVTWKSIVTVLESRSVDEGGLAKTIMKKYCQSEPNISKGVKSSPSVSSPSVSVKSQSQVPLSNERSTQIKEPDSRAVIKYSDLTSSDSSRIRDQYLSQLRTETEEMRIHFMKMFTSFKENWERNSDADYDYLYASATTLFRINEEDNLVNSTKIFTQVLKRQSHLNFDLLEALISACGTQEDKEAAQKYREAFKKFARRSVLECGPDMASGELPEHVSVVFVLKKDKSFSVNDADDFKHRLCKMLGMKFPQILLHEFETGSIVIRVLVPSNYIRALTTVPLYCDRVLSLQNWNTRCIKFETQEPVHLDSLNVLRSVNFNEVILDRNKVKMVRIELEGAEYIALEYTESFCDESSADTGYIDYMNSLLSKRHRNVPAVKGVYYRSNPEEEKRQYPTIVIENLKPLKDAIVKEEMLQVNQVSLLLDVANSVKSFKHETSKHEVSVCTDAILVQETLSGTEARFCPLYGLSFASNISQSHDQEMVPNSSIPIVELQWMSDVVKFIHFKGSVTGHVNLPDNHVLKEMLNQKWLSDNDQFRPLNYKILCDEIESLLETEKTWVGLVAGFSDDLVEDEVQIHLILIGHTGVGKTSLRKHLKDEPIDMNETPTIVMEPEFLYRESVELLAANPFKCIKDVLSSSNSKVFLTMWDTGGQPIFQDLLPCFARLKCMYGIVFRLPDLQEFDSRPEIRPCDKHHESVTSPFTNKDILYRNLAYVQAYSCSMKEKFENLPIQASSSSGFADSSDIAKFPAAVVVGTCKDKCGDFDPLAVNETKLSLDRDIGEFVHNNNVSVYPVPHVSSYIHEIDNTVSGRDHDEGIMCLRDNISRCAQESSTKVHKSWKVFELRLKRLIYTKYVNLGIVPLIEAIALGKECKVDNPRAALMYFHELGVFMWYHMSVRESMKNFVVIDPKTLLQILSKVYCFDPGSIPPELKELLDKGMMTIDFFVSLLKQKASNIDDSWFMSFLEEHHLSVKLINPGQDIRCFLPSLLPITPNYENNLDENPHVSPLYIVPQSGYIPTGMFTRLLAALAGVTNGSTVWRIPLEDAHMPHVCRNQFEFVINDSLHLILSEFSRHIRIDCVHATIDESLYFHIASTIDVQLQRIVPRWMEEREFTFTFACKNGFCGEKLHFLTDKDLIFKSNEIVTCSNEIQSHLLPSQTVWLRNQTTNESESAIFEEALQEGVLDINMASIMFVGIDSPGSTSAKHLLFQEPVPTTYNATLLVNHEIYFKAEGDPTFKKLQPDTCTDVMLMSHCLCKSPAMHSTSGPEARLSIPDVSSQTPTASSQIAATIPKKSPASYDNPFKQNDDPVPGSSLYYGLPVEEKVKSENVEADLKAISVDLEDIKIKMEDVTCQMGQTTVNTTTDIEMTVLQLANLDNFTKYMTQLRDDGVVELYHVFDCGSHLLHMREILKIFIRNISLCVLATDLSSDLQQEELRLLTENEGFASRGLIIGTHSDFLQGRYSESSNAELKRLCDSGFIINNETSELNLFPMNCQQPERPDYEIAARIAKHSSLSANRKKFPFAWYVFGFKLRQILAGLNRSTLSVSNECMIIAKELNMDRPTVEAALTHLTEQNMIIYFRDILPDSVFAGVDIFSQIFSLIYNNRCKEQKANVWQFCIVTESQLKTVIEDILYSNASVADFILLFEKLLILAPCEGAHASYLMPCLLPVLDEAKINEIHDFTCSVSVPACIKCPSSGYELITMLASYLLAQTSHDWTISLNHLGAPLCLYKNCFKFMIESSQCFVNLSFFNGYLKISITSSDNRPVKVREIVNVILHGLERIKIILNAHKMFDFKVSFYCHCGSPDYEHAATYNRDRKTITCEIHKKELLPAQDSMYYEKWLDSEPSDVENNPEILTVHNVVKKLAQWSDKWISIAEGLKVPSAVISTIRVITTHQQSKDAALYRVVEWWFANSPNPEWSTIHRVIVDLVFPIKHRPREKVYEELPGTFFMQQSLTRQTGISYDESTDNGLFDDYYGHLCGSTLKLSTDKEVPERMV